MHALDPLRDVSHVTHDSLASMYVAEASLSTTPAFSPGGQLEVDVGGTVLMSYPPDVL